MLASYTCLFRKLKGRIKFKNIVNKTHFLKSVIDKNYQFLL